LVNEEYDKGKILAQFSVPILPEETEETLREKIKKLEHTHLPRVIQTLLLKNYLYNHPIPNKSGVFYHIIGNIW